MAEGGIKALVAVDGSWRAMSMVHFIAGQMEPRKVELKLFNVHDQLPEGFRDIDKNLDYLFRLSEVKSWDLSQRAHMANFMNQARLILERAGFDAKGIDSQIHERVRGVARDIIAEASRGYDMVAFARRGLGALQGTILGSVANKLVTKLTDIPLWVVGRRAKPGRVLLAVDGSESATRAAAHLARVASDNAAVTVFHAVRSPRLIMEYPLVIDELPPEIVHISDGQTVGQRAQRVMEEAAEALVASGFKRERIELKLAQDVSSRADAIVSAAKAGSYGLILMGRRGMSSVGEFSMGRVTAKVLQLAKGMAVAVVN
ncbi:UspA domain protein [Desulfarculus baarsii DSM 2075]|uniref:UspA domain protein n=1 Tax=Desulfarculus baarsii (strain ATCC 33931 / DSM 2075 / LMG 7858 / VKM B-1802 / 2st14) TaxID=644282 RepID=E1QDB5_DESB2|nr:universal stress protein [Desulfarculus baarsii]ADK83434.1 UspA domain protein [Desulfarculus baarsii DSM 2075]